MNAAEQQAFDKILWALELHMAAYSAAWKPGMEILEPVGDAALSAAKAVNHSEQHLDMVQPQEASEFHITLLRELADAKQSLLSRASPQGDVFGPHKFPT